jgi:hypothetical protein
LSLQHTGTEIRIGDHRGRWAKEDAPSDHPHLEAQSLKMLHHERCLWLNGVGHGEAAHYFTFQFCVTKAARLGR